MRGAEAVLVAALSLSLPLQVAAGARGDVALDARPVTASFRSLPMSFEANRGQTSPEVKFLSRGPGYTLFLTSSSEVVLAMRAGKDAPGQSVLRMQLAGAARAPQAEGLEILPGRSHYLLRREPVTDVPTYGKVRYREVYPGVDLVFYGAGGEMEYDFVVAAGADPSAIRLRFDGADRVELDGEGNLVLATAAGDVVQKAPRLYQGDGTDRREIAGRFVVSGQEARVVVGAYDRGQALVIDPVLSYSTFLGGKGWEQIDALAVDDNGHAYVTGTTNSIDYPNTFGLNGSGTNYDVFVTKLDVSGTFLHYSTFLDGGTDGGWGIDVDRFGQAYVTGYALPTFTATPGAYQTVFGGGWYDAYVVKLDSLGASVVYATLLGGNQMDEGHGIAVDWDGAVWLTGETQPATWGANTFPTVGAWQAASGGQQDGFIAKLDRSGSALLFSTFMGGSDFDAGYDIAVDVDRSVYVIGTTWSTNFPVFNPRQPALAGGSDAVVLKLKGNGQRVYSTYHGGSSTEFGRGIDADSRGFAYVTGDTYSWDFPVAVPLQPALSGWSDAFVSKLDPRGSALVYSTFLGGSDWENGSEIAVDACGSAHVTGVTNSANFPVLGSLQAFAGPDDAYVAKLKPTGSALYYSTLLGGRDFESIGFTHIDLDPKANATVAGATYSDDFPTVSPFQMWRASAEPDGFVSRLVPRRNEVCP
jgi:beta-propeller repeat-containing protein